MRDSLNPPDSPAPVDSPTDGLEDDENTCPCGDSLDGGDGYDGLCGNCADRADSLGKWGFNDYLGVDDDGQIQADFDLPSTRTTWGCAIARLEATESEAAALLPLVAHAPSRTGRSGAVEKILSYDDMVALDEALATLRG